MKFTINIEKKHLFFVMIIFSLAFVGFVSAVWDDGKTFWHDAMDVRVKINNTFYSLQEAIDNGLLGSGGGNNEGGSGSALLSFSVPNGYTEDVWDLNENFTKSCSGIRSRNDKVTYNTQIDAQGKLVPGRFYDFSCSYGSDNQVSVKRYLLNASGEMFLADGSERHVERISRGEADYSPTTDNDNFQWYAVYNNGKLDIILKRLDANAACRYDTREVCGQVCKPGSSGVGGRCVDYIPGCQTQSVFVCDQSKISCPVYSADSGLLGLRERDIQAWKGVRCTIREA